MNFVGTTEQQEFKDMLQLKLKIFRMTGVLALVPLKIGKQPWWRTELPLR